MMLQEYQAPYNVRPTGRLGVYCREEGLDPMYISSTGKKQKGGKIQKKSESSVILYFLRKLTECKKIKKQLNS